MAIGWVIVAGESCIAFVCLLLSAHYEGLLKALFARFDLVTSLVIAACLTPTDPAISAAIIGKFQYYSKPT